MYVCVVLGGSLCVCVCGVCMCACMYRVVWGTVWYGEPSLLGAGDVQRGRQLLAVGPAVTESAQQA